MLDVEHQARESMRDLGLGEKVVLWSVRARLEGPDALERIREGLPLYHDALASDAAFGAFEPWFLIVANHCRRDLYLHRPRCPCVSEDERAMLDLLAYAQAEDPAGAQRLAASLVHGRALVAFLGASLTFAQALARLGLHLPRRGPMPPPASGIH